MISFTDYILKHITSLVKPGRALDLGAGALNQSAQLSEEGFSVDAVEPTPPENILVPSGVKLYKMTAQDFDYPENTYDLVVFRMVAQRLPQDFLIQLLNELLPRTLKSGGLLYLMIPERFHLPVELSSHYLIRGQYDFDLPEGMGAFKTIRVYFLQKKSV